MILFAKHLVLMSLALFAVPLLGRVFAQLAGRTYRVVRPGLGLLFVLWRILLALLLPVLAQSAFGWFGGGAIEEPWPRYAALALVGGIYGATIGDFQDFPPLGGAFWGIVGGLGTALLYSTLPASGEARALCVALFAALPLLAYQPFRSLARGRLSSSGLIVPNRRMLR